MSSSDELLKRIESVDGKRFVELRAQGSFFVFEEFTETSDLEYTFMAPTHCSGLYATPAEAERDMFLELPWLRDSKVR